MSQPEARLSRLIMKALKKQGAWVFKVHGSEYQPAGIPDILGCYRGRLIGVESKMPGNSTSAIQDYRIKQIEQAGGHVVVAYSVDDALKLLAIIDKEEASRGQR